MTTKQPWYRPVGREVELFEHAHRQRLPLLLAGPTGCGKTRFLEAMAAQLELPLITVACHDETSSIDLVGRFLIRGAETIWQDGPVTRAVRAGAILYLDELIEAREDVIVVLHSLTDHRRELYIDRLDETLVAPEGFMVVASFNPGYARGFKELRPSTRQRFVVQRFAYPEAKVETEIVAHEGNVENGNAKRLVDFANKVRGMEELQLAETVSTRLLVTAGKLMASGIAPRAACNAAVVQPITDDHAQLEALQDLANLMF
jgi:nitric oxide reductase NorQ protein